MKKRNFFNEFSTDFNNKTEHTQKESYNKQTHINFPVKLIEPSIGRIVKLEVTEQNDCIAKMYMDMLKTYAEGLQQYGVQWTITNKTIQIIFTDDTMAEIARQTWGK